MKQSMAVRAITRRLKGHSITPFHVVFERWQVHLPGYNKAPGRTATVGVWINTDELRKLAQRAASNISRKAKDGALNVEVHFIEEAKETGK